MYQDIGKTYQTILDYASRHHLELGAYTYEDYVAADIAQRDSAGYTIRMLIEVVDDGTDGERIEHV